MLAEQTKCVKCVNLIDELNHKTSIGFRPFAWGPSTENSCHFYVCDEQNDEEGLIDVIPLCSVTNPLKREYSI